MLFWRTIQLSVRSKHCVKEEMNDGEGNLTFSMGATCNVMCGGFYERDAEIALARTAAPKHLRGKDAHQVENVVSPRFRAEDKGACHEDGANLLVLPIDDSFGAAIDNLEICWHSE